MINILVCFVGPLMTNCYLLRDEATGAMAVVDPGGKSDKLIKEIEKNGRGLDYVILTHGHYDHIGFAKQLAEMFSAKVVGGFKINMFLNDNVLNHSRFHSELDDIEPFDADILLNDGDTFMLGETEIKYIYTPGHTADSGCYIFNDSIISGDTLFCESYGRTDLPTGNDFDMINSLKKLKEIEGDYEVFPGHGMSTTLEYERKNNPLMRRL